MLDRLSNIKDVEGYVSATQEITKKRKNTKIGFAIVSCITTLKSLEVEYFSKYQENGVTCFLYERLLDLPPSDSWGLLNQKLIGTLQYWLEAVQTQLSHNDFWWKFLKLILKIIKEISLKNSSMPDKLVELTADSLFHLAIHEKLSIHQRHDVLHCLNVYCAKASKAARLAKRGSLIACFTRLASQMTSCGYLPLQYRAMEALVRWLLPRDQAAKRAAAALWFPPPTCPEAMRHLFISYELKMFSQEARSVLAALNDATGQVTSALIKKFTITVGEMNVVDGSLKRIDEGATWMDINSGLGSITVLVHPRALSPHAVGRTYATSEAVVLEAGSTRSLRLHSECREVTLTVNMYQPPLVLPCELMLKEGGDVSVIITISSKSDLTKVDAALRAVFRDKYHTEINLDKQQLISTPSREMHREETCQSDGSEFSQSLGGSRTMLADNILNEQGNSKNIYQGGSQSAPSLTPTTSQEQLHDNQAKHKTFHRRRFDKEYYKFYAYRDLSTVKEFNETEDFHGVQSKHLKKYKVGEPTTIQCKNKAESDSELLKQQDTSIKEELATNSLFVAAVGTDESVISDTLDKFPKKKPCDPTNVVDLLIREVLEAAQDNQLKDSGINSDDKNSREKGNFSEAIENTPTQNVRMANKTARVVKKKPCVVVSKTTTDDESNTEATLLRNFRTHSTSQALVNARIRESKLPQNIAIESECNKNNDKQSSIKDAYPTENTAANSALAEKINKNKSATYTSDSFDENCLIMNDDLNLEALGRLDIIDIEVTECLNDMVDRVCKMLQHCSKTDAKESEYDKYKSTSTINKNYTNTAKKNPTKISKQKKNVKFASKGTKKPKPAGTTRTELPKKMSTITERNDEDSPTHNEIEVTKIHMPIINKDDKKISISHIITRNRKRPLYSFKKSRENFVKSPSPSTLENDALFDKLKSTVENNVKVALVKPKSADDIYNFSSDSEDSDFKTKKIQLRKRLNAKKNIESESPPYKEAVKQRNRRNNSKQANSSDAKKVTRTRNRNKSVSKINNKGKVNIETENLNDERMRDKCADDVLNTSIVAAKSSIDESKPYLKLVDPPHVRQMEFIAVDKESVPGKEDNKRKKPKSKTKQALSLVKNKSSRTTFANDDDSGTSSPMPGLIVENVPTRKDETNDLNIDVLEKQLQQIDKTGRDPGNDTSNTQNMLLYDAEKSNTKQNLSTVVLDSINIHEKEIFMQNVETATSITNMNTKLNNIKPKGMKKQKTSKNQMTDDDEVIICDSVPEEHDVLSEKSISTNGIQAHANSDERPPSPTLLENTIPPREVDDAVKKFMQALYRSKIPVETNIVLQKSENNSTESDPCHFSYHVPGMLPSRRTTSNSSISEYDENIQKISKPSLSQRKTIRDEITKTQDSKLNADLVKKRSPIVSVVPLSIDEIKEITSKSLESRDESENSVLNLRSALPPVLSKHANVSFRKTVRNTRKENKNISYFHLFDDDKEIPSYINEKNKSSKGENLNVLISDIQKIDNNSTQSPYKTRNEKHISKSCATCEEFKRYSDDTGSLNENNKVSKRKSKDNKIGDSNNKTANKSNARLTTISPIDMTCFESQNINTKRSSVPMKRRSISPILHGGKIFATEPIITSYKSKMMRNEQKTKRNKTKVTRCDPETNSEELESQKSQSQVCSYEPEIIQTANPENVPVSQTNSVYEWFQRNDCTKRDSNSWAQIVDLLRSVMEKLDTSLAVSNENTIKEFVELFRELKKQQAEHQEEQREVKEAVVEACAAASAAATAAANAAAAVAAGARAASAAAVAALKKSEGNNAKMIKQLNETLPNMIRKTRKQKELVVNILKEDIRAALEYIERVNNNTS